MPEGFIQCSEISPREPFAVARALTGLQNLAFLDSGKDPSGLGRFSYVAADPFGVFRVIDGQAFWNDTPLGETPFEALRILLNRYHIKSQPGLPPFQTGAIGFFSYEAARFIEKIPDMPAPEQNMPDMELGFYDVAFIHDHAENRSMILSSGWPETTEHRRKERAEARINEMLMHLDQPTPPLMCNPPIEQWTHEFSQKGFEAAVSETIERILAGDVFQANLAQRFLTTLHANFSSLSFYATLRDISPAPFGSYLAFGDLAIASNSPERFLTLIDRHIEARPIKGTAPRGDTPEGDAALALALTQSVKDRAENTMIVDLLRNDLSRVAELFSVKVPMLCGLETYASVHHLVSVVEAKLAEPHDAIDLIQAAFPCGSITGAPKIKAMEIIGALERVPRGVYCGSIGWLGFNGNLDLSVAIRTVTFCKGKATFHAGGGITALSNPQDEYQETLVKAERIFSAFRRPGGEGEA